MFDSSKKKHFKKKLEAIHKKMWDVEFLKDQYKLTREGFRVEYDRLKELEDAANTRIAQEKTKEDPDKTIIEQLNKLIERYTPDMSQLKNQMAQYDLLIEGPAPAEQQNRPLNEVIDNLRGIMATLKGIIKKL